MILRGWTAWWTISSGAGSCPWLCLCYGNGIYDGDAAKAFGAVGYPPVRNEKQKQAWHRYVIETVRRYKGRIAWFEVWNEPDWCWKHGVSGTEYGEFVKATAKAVHEGNPDAKVIGGSFCSNKWEWLHEVFETGAGMEMDAFTYHGYTPDELVGAGTRIQTIRAFCHCIQSEDQADSRRNRSAVPPEQRRSPFGGGMDTGETGEVSCPSHAGASLSGCRVHLLFLLPGHDRSAGRQGRR